MFQRLLGLFVAVLFVVAVFVFTTFLVAVAVTSGLIGYAWLWWRSRKRRGRVIEGEYRVIESR